MSDIDEARKLREKYTRFRILAIGRANSGKTTLLKRVCNTTEEPCIYDEDNNNLVRFHLASLSPGLRLLTHDANTARTDFAGMYRLIRRQHADRFDQRGIHDIERSFVFKSNPRFIFHDSPGFEAGDERQLKDVLMFIEKRSKSNKVDDQLHVIWFVPIHSSLAGLLFNGPLQGFAFFWMQRDRFWNLRRDSLMSNGRGMVCNNGTSSLSPRRSSLVVPVIAIFTKFDDLVTQVYDINREDAENVEAASRMLEEKFEMPLKGYRFPPRAYVCVQGVLAQFPSMQS